MSADFFALETPPEDPTKPGIRSLREDDRSIVIPIQITAIIDRGTRLITFPSR